MKVMKNLVTIASSLWTRYLILKKLYANFRITWHPLPLFAYIRILMDPSSPLIANVITECPLCNTSIF